MPETPSVPPTATRRIPLAIGAVVVGALIGFAGIYGLGGLKHASSGDSACALLNESSRSASIPNKMRRFFTAPVVPAVFAAVILMAAPGLGIAAPASSL